MNNSRSDITKKDSDKTEKKKKNIREIYLESVNQNRGTKGIIRSKNISNIQNIDPSASGSNYLEKEYNLVKKILNATKALEKLKTTSETSKNDSTIRSSAPKFKTPEEYYEEILELKKSLKISENNEMIAKAKLEYYDNELAKKEQEILNLLDVKKAEESRAVNPESKNDLETINSKIKALRLEFALKRKDAELNKLKTDLKISNMKELKIQNERLRAELSKALMNDKKIIEAQEIKGMTIKDGKLVYDLEKLKDILKDSSINLSKTEIAKQNIAKKLQKTETYEDEYVSKHKDIKGKLILKGSLRDKLEQLDERETELLQDITRLNKELDRYKRNEKHGSSLSNHRSTSSNSDKSDQENGQLNAIKILQSVMRGHLERTKSINKELNEIEHSKLEHRDKSRSRSRSRSRDRNSFRELDEYRDRSRSRSRSWSPVQTPSPRKYKPESGRNIRSQEWSSAEEFTDNEQNDDSKKLIDQNVQKSKKVTETDGGCCSPWRSRKSKS